MKGSAMKNGVITLLVLLFMCFFAVQNASATPINLTGVDIGYGGPTYDSYYTVYDFTSDQTGGPLDAFCVDPSHVNEGVEYELIDAISADTTYTDAQWEEATKMADHYFTGKGSASGWSQSEYQIAIWDTLGVTITYSNDIADVNAILAVDWGAYAIDGPLGLAHSPRGGEIPGGQSQDFLIAVNVPEPATLMFLGLSFLGIAGIGVCRRKKLF